MPEGRRLPELRTIIRADTTELKRARLDVDALQTQLRKPIGDGGLGTFSRRLADNSKALQVFGRNATRYLTLPIVAAGVVSVKLANDFDTSFTRMVNLAGVTAGEVEGLKESVLDLSRATGEGPQDLADGLEVIRSAGITGAAAVDTLTIAAKASAIGLGTTREVADAVSSVLNAYGQANISAARAADILAASVQVAKVEASELAPEFGRVLPLANALGVGFEEVGGSIAFLTKGGGSASESVTKFAGVLRALNNPSVEAVKTLEAVGLTIDEVKRVVREQGLLQGLQLLEARLGSNSLAFQRVIPDAEGAIGALQLLADGGRPAAAALVDVADSTDQVVEGFQRWEKTDVGKQQKALAELKVAMTELGAALAPVVADVAGSLAGIAKAFADLPAPIRTGLLAIVALVGPVSTALGTIGNRIQVLATTARAGGTGFDVLGAKGAGAATKLSNAAILVAAGVGAYAATTTALQKLSDKFDDTKAAGDRYGLSFQVIAEQGKVTGALLENFGGDFAGLAEKMDLVPKDWGEKLGMSAQELFRSNEAAQDIDELDDKLAEFARSSPENAKAAAVAFNFIDQALRKQGKTSADIGNFFDTYAAAAADAVIAETELGKSVGASGDAFAAEVPKIGEGTSALVANYEARKQVIDSLLAQIDAALSEQDAQLALNDAHRASEDALQDYAEAVDTAAGNSEELRDASQAVADAEAEVVDASEAVADAVRGVADAERGVVDAQRNAQQAQEDLNDARVEAAERLEDLKLAAEDAAIGEERAEIRLREAQERLANFRFTDPRASADERRSAELDVEEARLALERARGGNVDAAEELLEAQRKGIEQSDLVTEAQRRLVDANLAVTVAVDGVGEAERRVTEARAGVVEAQQRVTDAQADYLDKIEEAKDALPELEDAAVKAAEAEVRAGAAVKGQMDGAILSVASLALTLDPASPLRKRLQETLDLLDAIEGDRVAHVDVVFEGKPFWLQPDGGRAAGGRVRKRRPVWVGEEGRELFFPDEDGFVVSHAQSLNVARSLETNLNLVGPGLARLDQVASGGTTVNNAAGVTVGDVNPTVVLNGQLDPATLQRLARISRDNAQWAVDQAVRGLSN